MKRLFFGVIAGLLVACGTQVAALSGADEARLASLETATAAQFVTINELKASVIALQGTVSALNNAARPSVFVQAPSITNLRSASRARSASAFVGAEESSGCVGLGTLTGRPENSNPITSSLIAGVSCTGYLYVISDAASEDELGLLQAVPDNARFFATTDCSGASYVSRRYNQGALSADAFVKGAVFTDPGLSGTASYLYLPAGAARSTVVLQSIRTSDGECGAVASSLTIDDAVQLLPNDPAVTGLPSEPISGPITIGTGI